MKILSTEQLYKADQVSLAKQGISSWQLMERASLRAVESMLPLVRPQDQICILAGTGNNGGDGLSIAYHLYTLKYQVEVLIFKYSKSLSSDCEINFNRLTNETDTPIKVLNNEPLDFSKYSVFVDAVFGIGLNRTMANYIEKAFKTINQSKALKIAIDVPSGLFLSTLTPVNSTVFKAQHTLTFQCPKLNFFLPDFGDYIGELKVIDIGLDSSYLKRIETNYWYCNKAFIQKLIKPRKRFSHKGTYGHALVVGGKRGMMGCMVLATRSTIRSGAGKVSVVIPECGTDILQITIPEAMVIASHHNSYISQVEIPFQPKAVCIGMGIGQSEEAKNALKYYLNFTKTPMIIDADALNIISENRQLLDEIPPQSILTPHQGELQTLIGEWSDEYEKIEKIKNFSKSYNFIIVSKDAYTMVVFQDEVYINSTGNSGMATAGSGDVLSGLITGLVAQGYAPLDAALLGVYLHGSSGDIYTSTYHKASLIASDLVENIKHAFTLLEK